ncbi:MAG: hypothetical protein U0931_37070 [Vulcanimicrobiota bacterium]
MWATPSASRPTDLAFKATGQVRFSPPPSIPIVWEHAYDFLADWVQHIPRASQHQVTYAGHFANALSNLKLPTAYQSESE